MSKSNKKSQKKGTEVPEELTDEISQYLLQNKKIIEQKSEEEKEISEIKAKNAEIIKSNQNLEFDEIFKLIVEELKSSLALEKEIQQGLSETETKNNEIKNFYNSAKNVDRQCMDLEKHNKSILEKLKLLKEEKVQLKEQEELRNADVIKQLEKFKEDSLYKYNSSSIDLIQKDNAVLEEKLKECQAATQSIKDNIDQQEELRKKQNLDFENMFQKQLGFDPEENDRLRGQLDDAEEKYHELTSDLKVKSKSMGKVQRELEKILRDLSILNRDHKELIKFDPIALKEQIEKDKEELQDYVNKNKELQASIKKMKEELATKELAAKELAAKELPSKEEK